MLERVFRQTSGVAEIGEDWTCILSADQLPPVPIKAAELTVNMDTRGGASGVEIELRNAAGNAVIDRTTIPVKGQTPLLPGKAVTFSVDVAPDAPVGVYGVFARRTGDSGCARVSAAVGFAYGQQAGKWTL